MGSSGLFSPAIDTRGVISKTVPTDGTPVDKASVLKNNSITQSIKGKIGASRMTTEAAQERLQLQNQNSQMSTERQVEHPERIRAYFEVKVILGGFYD